MATERLWAGPFSDRTDGSKPSSTDHPSFRSRRRDEVVYYDSARAVRSFMGRCNHGMTCPGWTKLTSKRVVHSTWHWQPCCSDYFKCPCGRTIDTFDNDIIVDLGAHQTCCQICRGEGDITVYRVAGGDPSHPGDQFVVANVPEMFSVFDRLTVALSRLNLSHFKADALGHKMGAQVWDAPAGGDGPAQVVQDEMVYYDSSKVDRTLLGRCANQDCCAPPYYKVTSERVLYTKWDWAPCCCDLLTCPWGRTLGYFDADLITDIQAYQSCSDMALNEGDLIIFKLAGGDVSESQGTPDSVVDKGCLCCSLLWDGSPGVPTSASGVALKFKVRNVPEVFATFDDISYELSLLNLSHFSQNVVGEDMKRG